MNEESLEKITKFLEENPPQSPQYQENSSLDKFDQILCENIDLFNQIYITQNTKKTQNLPNSAELNLISKLERNFIQIAMETTPSNLMEEELLDSNIDWLQRLQLQQKNELMRQMREKYEQEMRRKRQIELQIQQQLQQKQAQQQQELYKRKILEEQEKRKYQLQQEYLKSQRTANFQQQSQDQKPDISIILNSQTQNQLTKEQKERYLKAFQQKQIQQKHISSFFQNNIGNVPRVKESLLREMQKSQHYKQLTDQERKRLEYVEKLQQQLKQKSKFHKPIHLQQQLQYKQLLMKQKAVEQEKLFQKQQTQHKHIEQKQWVKQTNYGKNMVDEMRRLQEKQKKQNLNF